MTDEIPHHEYDSPWKLLLTEYFEQFMQFFFSDVAEEIDWSQPYESLDKELETLVRSERQGRQIVDKLVKVWRKSGQEIWVLIHVEIQGTREQGFEMRMFNYWSAIRLLYQADVFSCAILTDNLPSWRPNSVRVGIWGTGANFAFRTIKLLDYDPHIEQLESNQNPFGLAIVAHLITLKTRPNDPDRKFFKYRLFRILYEKGYSRKMIFSLMAFLDWIVVLSKELNVEFQLELRELEKEYKMEYIPTWARESYYKARKEGLADGIAQGIEQGIEQGIAQGREQGRAERLDLAQKTILSILNARFDTISPQITDVILATDDLERLKELAVIASISDSIQTFSDQL